MSQLSPTQKSYGALGSSSRCEETKKDSSAIGKFDGVGMAVVPAADRLVSDQKPAAIKNISMEEFSFSPSDNEEKRAFKMLQNIKAEIKEVQQGGDLGKEALLNEAVWTAQAVHAYSKICQSCDPLTFPSHSIILDQFKGAFALRLKAAEHSDNFEARNYYSEAAGDMEQAANFSVQSQKEGNLQRAGQLTAAAASAEAGANARKEAALAVESKNSLLENRWIAIAFNFEEAARFRENASNGIRDENKELTDRSIVAAEKAEAEAISQKELVMNPNKARAVTKAIFDDLVIKFRARHAIPENLDITRKASLQQASGLRGDEATSSSGIIAGVKKVASSMKAFRNGNNSYESIPDDTAAVVNPLHVPNDAVGATETTSLLKKRNGEEIKKI